MGCKAVELIVDFVSVEHTIKESMTYSRSLVNKIRCLLDMDWNVNVSHSYQSRG